VILTLKEGNPKALQSFIASLPESKRDQLKQILNSQRVVLNPDEGKTQARKIVKARGRKVANPNNLNG